MKYRLFILIFAFLSLAPVCVGKNTATDERKADYYFMEALRQRALENEDLAYAMFCRALELSPDKSGREAYEVGIRLLQMGNVEEDTLAVKRAIALIDRYFNAHTSDVYAGALLANINQYGGNIDRALEIYDTLTTIKPDNINLAANHADLLLSQQRFDEAEAIYRRLEKNMGRNVALTQRISNIKLLQNDTIAALAEIDDLIAVQPRSIEALQLGTSACLTLNMPERALDYIERSIELDPANGLSYYYASQVLTQLNRDEDAAEALSRAIMSDDLDSETQLELLYYYSMLVGRVAASEGKSDDEIAEEIDNKCQPLIESLVNHYPNDYNVRFYYMRFFASQKKWEEAAEQMGNIIELFPASHTDYVTYAQMHYFAENQTAALDAINQGIAKFPDEYELYEVKAIFLLNFDETETAVKVLREALEISSLTDVERSEIYCNIADMLQKDESVSDADEVRANYEKALSLNAENHLAMNNYAYWLSTSGGDLLKAKDLIKKAVVYEPSSATYYDTYAWVCFKLGELSEAKLYIDMAILFDKSEQEGKPSQIMELLEHAAEIYDKIGQHDKADEYRKRVEELKQL